MLDWGNLSSLLVLLVEDEPDNAEVIEMALSFSGISVRTAQNGVEGLEILQNFLPDLILLDLSMSKMDGWEMRARVKSDPRTQHIPVVALTAHAMSGDKELAMEAGFNGYLTKPINVPTFINDLRTALEIEVPTTPQGNAGNSTQPVVESLKPAEVAHSKETSS